MYPLSFLLHLFRLELFNPITSLTNLPLDTVLLQDELLILFILVRQLVPESLGLDLETLHVVVHLPHLVAVDHLDPLQVQL